LPPSQLSYSSEVLDLAACPFPTCPVLRVLLSAFQLVPVSLAHFFTSLWTLGISNPPIAIGGILQRATWRQYGVI
jgi:hypothetical protein